MSIIDRLSARGIEEADAFQRQIGCADRQAAMATFERIIAIGAILDYLRSNEAGA